MSGYTYLLWIMERCKMRTEAMAEKIKKQTAILYDCECLMLTDQLDSAVEKLK